MADVKWIKIVTDIFDDEKILLIESMPDADSLIVIWFKLLCLAGKQNNHGVFMINDRIHYTDEMFATIFRRNLNTVRLALDTFERFGMIERIDGTITIPNWGKHQTFDKIEAKNEYMRNYMREYRAKQKALSAGETDEEARKDNRKTNSRDNVSEADKNKNKNNVVVVDIARARAREENKNMNPYGDCEFIPPKDTVQQLASNYFGCLTARQMEEINSFIEDLNEDVVRHAIYNAADNGGKTWNYVKAILNAYVSNGVKTVVEAKALDDKYQKNKKRGCGTGGGYNNRQQQSMGIDSRLPENDTYV